MKIDLPCMACINIDGILDKNNIGTEVDIDRSRYDAAADAKAKVMADRPPKRSPNLPNNGPPASCTTAKVVCK